jgi:mono/diheme cytochrome c family protein
MVAGRRGVALLAAALAAPLGAAAQDAQRGKLLYETHCGECHYERVHERLRSGVKDIADLRDTVWRWSRKTTRRSFSVEELDDITGYLNASHYHFASEQPKKP